MTFKITLTYPNEEPKVIPFDDPTNCKCPTSRYLRDLIKEDKFERIVVERV